MSSVPAQRTLPDREPDLGWVRDLVAEELRAVDRRIAARLQSEVALVNQVAQYIINGGGKRLRPLLVLLGARAFDYGGAQHGGEQHVELAAVIEFIHTATLLHDDVVDASALRRGRETANNVWGNEASVLVGDFLYSRSFQMLVGVQSMPIMQILADTTNVIAEGEVMQLLNCRDPETTEEQYLKVIRSKTAKLFEAAARIGAVLGDAPAPQLQAMAEFGMCLGTAYQLVDDVLDYEGSSQQIGKNVGDDLAEGKPTLPLIYAIQNGSAAQAATISEAIRTGGREKIDRVVEAVEATGAITYTSRAARHQADLAMKALDDIPPSSFKRALRALADFSVARSY